MGDLFFFRCAQVSPIGQALAGVVVTRTKRHAARLATAGGARRCTGVGQWARREDGQALVEFALIVPLLLLVIVAMADFGIAYQRYTQMTNAVREGARYGSTYPTRINSANNADPENVNARVRLDAVGPALSSVRVNYLEANLANPTPRDATVTSNQTAYAKAGNGIQVIATLSYSPMTPFANTLFPGGQVQVSATSVMRIE